MSDPPQARAALQELLNGYRSTALLCAAARLGLADLLADGPLGARDLAARLNAHEPSLRRLLRGLAAIRVLDEHPGGSFSLSPAGSLLRSAIPGSLHGLAILIGEEYMPAWGGLLHTVMTGGTAYKHVFGAGPWEHRQEHPHLGESFQAWLSGVTAAAAGTIAASFDLEGSECVMDIAGGGGAVLAAILRRYPGCSGVLFDLPEVVPFAQASLREAGAGGRCDVVGGDMFTAVPAGCDVHVIKSVLHDWADGEALAILRSSRRALPESGRLLVVERLLPEFARDDMHGTMLDIHMMAVTGGRERSEPEFRGLLEGAGFRVRGVTPTPAGFAIIEATPAV